MRPDVNAIYPFGNSIIVTTLGHADTDGAKYGNLNPLHYDRKGSLILFFAPSFVYLMCKPISGQDR